MVILNKNIREYLRDKKILLAQWDCESKTDPFAYSKWYLPFKGICRKITLFCPKKNYFQYGRLEMNKRFLELVRKEKPDFIFFLLIYDEFDPQVFLKIKEISPKTKLIDVVSDDYWRYEDFGIPYSIFFDYLVVILCPEAVKRYKKEGINAFLSYGGVNTEEYHPLDIPKRYNVGFIGRPKQYMANFLRFLVKNNVDVHIWGHAWGNYPDLEKNYHGAFDADKWSETVNQIKINLNFSRGGEKLQLKGRPWEIGACKSFVLSDYFKDYTLFFKEDKELVFFKNKEDLLKKIRYFLSHEKEREKIAEAMYKKIINKYSLKRELNPLFEKIISDEKRNNSWKLPAIPKKIISLSNKDVNSEEREIIQKIKNFDYVCFKGKNKVHELKEYIQAYSLEKSGKLVSCCDYYVNSKKIGRYLLLKASLNFLQLSKQDFNRLLVPEQLMVDKDFFLNNLNAFRRFFNDKGLVNIINEKNTSFVSIPLVEVSNIPSIEYNLAKKAFQMKFLDKLYSLKYQNRMFSSPYAFNLLLEAINGKFFIIKALKDAVFDKSKIDKLKKGF